MDPESGDFSPCRTRGTCSGCLLVVVREFKRRRRCRAIPLHCKGAVMFLASNPRRCGCTGTGDETSSLTQPRGEDPSRGRLSSRTPELRRAPVTRSPRHLLTGGSMAAAAQCDSQPTLVRPLVTCSPRHQLTGGSMAAAARCDSQPTLIRPLVTCSPRHLLTGGSMAAAAPCDSQPTLIRPLVTCSPRHLLTGGSMAAAARCDSQSTLIRPLVTSPRHLLTGGSKAQGGGRISSPAASLRSPVTTSPAHLLTTTQGSLLPDPSSCPLNEQ